MSDAKLVCPDCEGEQVVATEETAWLVNDCKVYCHSVRMGDDDAKAVCLACGWVGQRKDLRAAA